MSNKRQDRAFVFRVALAVCLVCSIVVSTSAVLLAPAQDANRLLDLRRNMLTAAGMLAEGADAEEVMQSFSRLEQHLVDLNSGRFAVPGEGGAPRLAEYELQRVLRDPALSRGIPARQDIAGLRRRERYAPVYLLREQGRLQRVVLPVRGYGLWSTLHGFLALEGDLDTVAGLGFYQHGETPGLGGEVDNTRWKALWAGKRVYAAGQFGERAWLGVDKGRVRPGDPRAPYRVDGLSGATLTSRGVDNLLRYWLGREGFGPFLKNLRQGST